MKKVEHNKAIIVGGIESFETKINSAGSDWIVSLLRSDLYTDKRKVALTEHVSNAIDASRTHGFKFIPEVVVSDSSVIVKDYASGCSKDVMRNRYFAYCASDKNDSNDKIGGFGIGSKSGSAYADTHYIKSRFDGESTLYVSSINGNTNNVRVYKSMPCGDDTGITVDIPLSEEEDLAIEAASFLDIATDTASIMAMFHGRSLFNVYRIHDDVQMEQWDGFSDDEKLKCKVDIGTESNTYCGMVSKIVSNCSYFDKQRDKTINPVEPDASMKLLEGYDTTMADIDKFFLEMEAFHEVLLPKFNDMSPDTACRSVISDIDKSELPEFPKGLYEASRLAQFDIIPGLGVVFRGKLRSQFYSDSVGSDAVMLACDGDFAYKVTRRYADVSAVGTGSFIEENSTVIGMFDRGTSLEIMPNRESVTMNESLGAWMTEAHSRLVSYYIAKTIYAVSSADFGSNCLLYTCACRSARGIDLGYFPIRYHAKNSILEIVTRMDGSPWATYSSSGVVEFLDKGILTRIYGLRRANCYENGKFALALVYEDGNKTLNASMEYARYDRGLYINNQRILFIHNDIDFDLSKDDLVLPDIEHLKSDAVGEFLDYIDTSLSVPQTRVSARDVAIVVIGKDQIGAMKTCMSVFRRTSSLAGIVEGVDLFKMSDIVANRKGSDYYEKHSAVMLCAARRLEGERLRAISVAAEEQLAAVRRRNDAEEALAKLIAEEEAAKAAEAALKSKKPAAPGSSTLTEAKPVSCISYDGYKSKNGDPMTCEELEAQLGSDPFFDSGYYKKLPQVVMIPSGVRFKNSDVLASVLLKPVTESPCSGHNLRRILGVRKVVRVLPSAMDRLAREKGWQPWTEVDYMKRLQAAVNTASIAYIPLRLYVAIRGFGLEWTTESSSRIKTNSAYVGCRAPSVNVPFGIGFHTGLPVPLVWTCIMYTLSAITHDTSNYRDFMTKLGNAHSGVASFPVDILCRYADKVGDNVFSNFKKLSKKDSELLIKASLATKVGRSHELGSLLGTDVCDGYRIDVNKDKCYSIVVKAMSEFNKPINLSAVLGVKTCVSDSCRKNSK